MSAEELVEAIGRIGEDGYRRRLSIGGPPGGFERLGAALADELSRVDPARFNGA